MRDANQNIYYSKQGDYRTKTHIFEIGGKNKPIKQITNVELPAYLICDDIVTASKQIIPLLFLGFIY